MYSAQSPVIRAIKVNTLLLKYKFLTQLAGKYAEHDHYRIIDTAHHLYL